MGKQRIQSSFLGLPETPRIEPSSAARRIHKQKQACQWALEKRREGIQLVYEAWQKSSGGDRERQQQSTIDQIYAHLDQLCVDYKLKMQHPYRRNPGSTAGDCPVRAAWDSLLAIEHVIVMKIGAPIPQ